MLKAILKPSMLCGCESWESIAGIHGRLEVSDMIKGWIRNKRKINSKRSLTERVVRMRLDDGEGRLIKNV